MMSIIEHLSDFLGEYLYTEHFSRKNGGLTWSILVGKQNDNVQRRKIWPFFSVFAPALTSRSINHDALSNFCVGYRLKLIWTVFQI